MTIQIPNAAGAFVGVTDFTTGRDAAGNQLVGNQIVGYFRANEAIAAGQAVGLVAPTATVPTSVEILDVSDAFATTAFIGVALAPAAAGSDVMVCVGGTAVVDISTGTVAAFNPATKHASADGCLAAVVADATTVVGTLCGWFMGAEIGTSNTALCWIAKR